MTAKLQVQLEALIGTYFSDLTRAADKLQDFQAKAQRAGTALTAAFTLPLTLFGRQAVKSGAELDGLNRSMTAIEGTAEKAGKRIAVLNEIAKLPGLNFKDAVQGDVNLRSAGLSAELAAKSMSAFGNALGILGKQGGLGNVNQQIQQMATKTQGFGADLKILKEWVPQVGTALQQAFGTTNADMIATMGITGKEAIEKIVNELAKLPKATGGLGNALENLDDAWFKFTGKIGLAIEKSIGLSSMIDKLSAGLTDLASWFENLDPFWQKTIIGITGITAAIGPLLLGMSALIPLFGNIGTAAGMLFSGPVLAALGAVTAGFAAAKIANDIYENGWISFWDRLTDKAEKASLKIQIALLHGLNVNGSTDFALNEAEKKLLNLNHDTNSHVSLGNESFAQRKNVPTSPTPRRVGGTAPAPEYELTIKDYQKIAENAERIKKANESWESAINKVNDRLRETQNFYKNIHTIAIDGIGKQSAGYDFLEQKTDAFFERMKKSISETSKLIEKEMPKKKEGDKDEKDTFNVGDLFARGSADIATGLASWAGAFAAGMKPIRSFAKELADLVGNMLANLGQALMMQGLKTANWGLAGIGLLASFTGSFTSASANRQTSVPQSSVGNYQPIYTPYNTPTVSSGAKVSIEINQGQTIQRGADIYTTQANYIYDKGR